MPFFSFAINEIKPPLTKYNITSNKVYFSKNTELWKLLNKINISKLNKLKQEKRHKIKKISEKILICLPPSMGLGDAIEYASAIKVVSGSNIFQKVAVAFGGEYVFLFKNYFNLENNFPLIISKTNMLQFDTIFHLSLEMKSFVNKKSS